MGFGDPFGRGETQSLAQQRDVDRGLRPDRSQFESTPHRAKGALEGPDRRVRPGPFELGDRGLADTKARSQLLLGETGVLTRAADDIGARLHKMRLILFDTYVVESGRCRPT